MVSESTTCSTSMLVLVWWIAHQRQAIAALDRRGEVRRQNRARRRQQRGAGRRRRRTSAPVVPIVFAVSGETSPMPPGLPPGSASSSSCTVRLPGAVEGVIRHIDGRVLATPESPSPSIALTVKVSASEVSFGRRYDRAAGRAGMTGRVHQPVQGRNEHRMGDGIAILVGDEHHLVDAVGGQPHRIIERNAAGRQSGRNNDVV